MVLCNRYTIINISTSMCIDIYIHLLLYLHSCTLTQFQRKQIEKYCRKHNLDRTMYTLPENETERNLLNRHLIFDDKRKSLFCFVEKIGCTDMKRLMFVTVGVLPERTIHHEWVDLKYLEKGLKLASFVNKNLTDNSRLWRMQNYFKFMIVRNPLERLVSGYRNKVMPPLNDLSLKFPNYVKRNIIQKYRPLDLQYWLNAGGRYNITISFPEFVQYFIDTKKEDLNPHFKPMVHTCHPCRVQYDFYGNFKTYSQDAKLVIRKLRMSMENYPNRSLHPSGRETRTYLEQYYRQLSKRQRTGLFLTLQSELEFYYSLYPEDRNSHSQLLGVQ